VGPKEDLDTLTWIIMDMDGWIDEWTDSWIVGFMDG
jgi:hypothetical protein